MLLEECIYECRQRAGQVIISGLIGWEALVASR